jgi:Rrf2 family transcriptional regulator, nitric oxide-sensitive transcriptional repressor
VRGRSGGLRLARPANEIRLGEVVRSTEPDFALVECFATGNQCVITGCCRLPRLLNQALAAFLDTLDQHTLASIALKPRDFRTVIGPAPQVAPRRRGASGPDCIGGTEAS